jgi:hypothetical protein
MKPVWEARSRAVVPLRKKKKKENLADTITFICSEVCVVLRVDRRLEGMVIFISVVDEMGLAYVCVPRFLAKELEICESDNNNDFAIISL